MLRATSRRAGLGLLLLVFAQCSPGEVPGPSNDVVRVGLLFPRTGPFAGITEDQIDGFTLYTDSKGGRLATFDAEFIHGDSANDPAVAVEVAQRMVERDEVDVIVGVISSAVASALGPMVTQTGVPIVLTAAAADELTQQKAAPNIFRVTGTASQLMMPLGSYACEQLGYETAATVALDYSLGWEATGGFARTFEDWRTPWLRPAGPTRMQTDPHEDGRSRPA